MSKNNAIQELKTKLSEAKMDRDYYKNLRNQQPTNELRKNCTEEINELNFKINFYNEIIGTLEK